MDPYDQVVAALKVLGFVKLGKPLCPCCPPNKRRGFDVTPAKTPAGRPTVLIKCFRGCDTLRDIVPTIGLDAADLFDGGQRTLFDAGRYCRVTTEGWKALPNSSARTFGIAASIGFYATTRSPFTILRTEAQWDAVRRESGVGDRNFRKQVDVWVSRKMAHRCVWGFLALYRAPFDRCPSCGRLTLEKRKPGKPSSSEQQSEEQTEEQALGQATTTRKYAESGTNGSDFRHGSDTTQETELIVPTSGTNGADFDGLEGLA
jgi:hypothetical protein